MKQICETCRRWSPFTIQTVDGGFQTQRGECRIHAPSQQGWPLVKRGDFCGDWAAHHTKPNVVDFPLPQTELGDEEPA